MRPETIAKVIAVRDALSSALCRPPSLREISARASLSHESVRKALAAANQNTSALRQWQTAQLADAMATAHASKISVRESALAQRAHRDGQVKALHGQGLNHREIAERLGLASRRVVGSILRRHGAYKRHDWMPAEHRDLLGLYAAGSSMDAIAAEVGRPRSTLCKEIIRVLGSSTYGRIARLRIPLDVLAACEQRRHRGRSPNHDRRAA